MAFRRLNKILASFQGLIRLRLSLAISCSATAGYLLASTGTTVDLIYTAAAIFLLSSGSSALNQYSERSTDARMGRTSRRPIPSGQISKSRALGFSIILLIAGSLLLLKIGVISFLLGLATILLYNFVYTGLKRRSALAILPGAMVGALPPLIGFFAAGRDSLSENIIFFSLFIFLWQMPHFLLILMKYGEEYRAAGFPIMTSSFSAIKTRMIVFSWVVLTSAYLIITGSSIFVMPVLIPLIFINSLFIYLFYRSIFVKKDPGNAFILINSFSLIVMAGIIAGAILGS